MDDRKQLRVYKEKEGADGRGDAFSCALKATGRVLGVPMRIFYVTGKRGGAACEGEQTDGGSLLGSFRLSESYFKKLLREISPELDCLYEDSPLAALLRDFDTRATVFLDGAGRAALVFRSGGLEFNFVKNAKGYYVLAAWDTETAPRMTDALKLRRWLQSVRAFCGAARFNLVVKSSGSCPLDTRLLRYLQQREGDSGVLEELAGFSCGLPRGVPWEDEALLAYARIRLSGLKGGFYETLAAHHPGETLLCAGMGEKAWAALSFSKLRLFGDVMIERFSILVPLSGVPVLSLSGEWNVTLLGSRRTLCIGGEVSPAELAFEAGLACESPLQFKRIAVRELAFHAGVYKAGLCLGGYGTVYVGDAPLFGLLIASVVGNAIEPMAAALAIEEWSLSALAARFTGKEIPGIQDFDFLELKRFPLEGTAMDVGVLSDLRQVNYPAIQREFSRHCSGKPGGGGAGTLAPGNMTVTKTGTGWVLTDRAAIRHYHIDGAGNITLAPQVYYSVEETRFLDLTLRKGIFACASLSLLGLAVNLYLEVCEEGGLETLVRIRRLETDVLTLGRAENPFCPSRPVPDMRGTPVYAYLSDREEGPLFYLCAKRGRMECWIDAGITFWKLFSVDALVVFARSRVAIDAAVSLWGFSVRLKVSAGFRDFNDLNFKVSMGIDAAAFRALSGELRDEVVSAVEVFQAGLGDAESVLADARGRALGLRRQIDGLDERIGENKRRLEELSWYQFSEAPYYLCLIGELEVARAGIYAALGAAYAALELAEEVFAGASAVSEEMLRAVRFVTGPIGSIFYINRLELSLGMADRSMEADLEADMVLFGDSLRTDSTIRLRGEGMEERIRNAVAESCGETVREKLGALKIPDAPRLHSEELFALFGISRGGEEGGGFYGELERRLDDAFAYLDTSDKTREALERKYDSYYAAEPPFAERFAQEIAVCRRASGTHWDGCLKPVGGIDLQPLIDAAASLKKKGGEETGIQRRWDELKGFLAKLPEKCDALRNIADASRKAEPGGRRGMRSAWTGKAKAHPGSLEMDIYEQIHTTSAKRALACDMPPYRYYINPRREPVLDKLMLAFLEHTEPDNARARKEAEENLERKKADGDYEVRVKV